METEREPATLHLLHLCWVRATGVRLAELLQDAGRAAGRAAPALRGWGARGAPRPQNTVLATGNAPVQLPCSESGHTSSGSCDQTVSYYGPDLAETVKTSRGQASPAQR